MEIKIRQEVEADWIATGAMIEKAFKKAEHSDQSEHLLIDRLRASEEFIPELSLVAEIDGEVIGHIMHTKITIDGCEFLALAPLAVAPEWQGKGVGSALVEQSHKSALALGYKGVVVLGDPNYYSRFGYKPAENWKIKCPFEVPSEYYMAIELSENAFLGVSGTVNYSKAFIS